MCGGHHPAGRVQRVTLVPLTTIREPSSIVQATHVAHSWPEPCRVALSLSSSCNSTCNTQGPGHSEYNIMYSPPPWAQPPSSQHAHTTHTQKGGRRQADIVQPRKSASPSLKKQTNKQTELINTCLFFTWNCVTAILGELTGLTWLISKYIFCLMSHN